MEHTGRPGPGQRLAEFFADRILRPLGMTDTAFWADQEADLTVSFFTQLLPSSTYPIRPELRQLVYQALTA